MLIDNTTAFAVQFENVFKAFPGNIALNGLELTIPSASLYVLLGPNGAGKTTALKMLPGLLQPDAGNVLVNGVNVAKEPAQVKRHIAYLPDEPQLYPLLRPLEYLEFIAALWSMPANQAGQEAEELLRWLEIWDHRGKYIESLSRGMKQKLALVGALLHHPTILLLDEPLTGLDVASAKAVKELMLSFVAKGNSVVLTTHGLDVVENIPARIGIINKGKMVADGTLSELQDHAGRKRLEDIFLKLVYNKL
ncbi:MAG: ABC transporter ATP-binding protein [Lysobacterales bacterium]